MSDIEPRGSRTPRRVREQRAYQLALAGATAGAVAVVGFVLALVGVIGFSLPVIAAVIAALCAVLFRRAVSR